MNIRITTTEEYYYLVARGIEPLLDKRIGMSIELRIEMQDKLFGKGHSQQENERFFRWVWEHKPHHCEETMKPLRQYSAVFCSHILTRGAYPEMAHDPRNINLLCFEMHNRWENGDRENMRIYAKNERIIQQLKEEYRPIMQVKNEKNAL